MNETIQRIAGKSAAVLGYILILCYFLKSEWTQVFSPKTAGLLLLGTGIMCLPWIGKKHTGAEWQGIIGKNALMAGYLEAFMLLFTSLGESEWVREGLLREIGLDLRPILYGYILYIVLERENTEDKREQEDKSGADAEETLKKQEISWKKAGLTRREKEVASLIVKGCSNREIAELLCISETTVKKHVSNIFEKLGIGSREMLRK